MAINRTQIAFELMRGCPAESRDDHQAIADALLAGDPVAQILSMDELDNWPETYAWLKGELSD